MTNQEPRGNLRLATISSIVNEAAPHPLGRTAVMKLVYFLQTLKGLPLGYNFRIYTYGPYDSQVLEDLKVAEIKSAVKSSVVEYGKGTGYAITPGSEADSITSRSSSLNSYHKDIASIIADFGRRSALDLEMASTIVFVDRTEASSGRHVNICEVAQKVREMKPRLDLSRIVKEAQSLKKKGYVEAIEVDC